MHQCASGGWGVCGTAGHCMNLMYVLDFEPLVLRGNSSATGTALVCKHIAAHAALANVPWLWFDS